MIIKKIYSIEGIVIKVLFLYSNQESLGGMERCSGDVRSTAVMREDDTNVYKPLIPINMFNLLAQVAVAGGQVRQAVLKIGKKEKRGDQFD